VNGQDGAADVVILEIKGLKLCLVQTPGEGFQGLTQVRGDVLAFMAEFVQDLELFLLGLEAVEDAQLFFELLFPLLEGLGFPGVLPGFGGSQLAVDGLNLGLELSEVKENL
jgi:hypothetical protein